jgi:Ser/Thr protein kinase RdoA (MazF antagonist)
VPHIASSYRREARVHAVLPDSAPTPRLLHEAEVDVDGDEWVVLVLEHVEGRMPGLPWTSADLAPTVRALEQLATSVRGLDWHEEASLLDFAEGDDLVGLWSAYDAAWLPDGLGTWVREHAGELRAATEHAGLALRGDDWTHADIRGDNLLVGADRAWVVDWNWLCRGPAWIDLALLLPMVRADGVDLAPAYSSWLLADVPAADLDAAVAWLGALMLAHVDDPVFPGGSPWLRPHQRWTGAACLSLLRERWTPSSEAPAGR